jgi:hypothetical protein
MQVRVRCRTEQQPGIFNIEITERVAYRHPGVQNRTDPAVAACGSTGRVVLGRRAGQPLADRDHRPR